MENVRHMYSGVEHMDTNNVGEEEFARMLADMLISKIDKNSITSSD